jgi:protoporphyrinogen oxidase
MTVLVALSSNERDRSEHILTVRISRRDLLAVFLGAPFAALACRRAVHYPLPPGEIVGASHAFGHILREVARPVPAANAWTSQDIVIAGAGVSGLAAAWRLAHAGVQNFTLLELEPVEGGTSRSGSSNVSAYPWGAHYIPAPMADDRTLIRLLNELGLIEGTDAAGDPVVGEQYLLRDPEERVFYRGRWFEGLYLNAGATHDDLRQLREFESEVDRWAAWRDGKGRRAFTIPIANASDDPAVMALDRISARQWLDQHGWTSPRLRWLIDYSCRDDYGTHPEDTSAWAVLFYFASRLPGPGKPSRPLITWPEGNGRLVRHLATASKGHIETGWLVTTVEPAGDHVDVTAVSRDGKRVHGIRAKHVVFAAPQFIAARVIPGYRGVKDFVYGSWLVANLTLSGHPSSSGFPLSWDNVLYESPSLGYVVATHQTGSELGPTVLTYYYAFCDRDPRVARERLLSAGRDEWAEVVLSDLERAHPDIRRLTQRLDIMRWGHAMIRPYPGFLTSPTRHTARQPFQNIHFANTDLSGVALFEEALHHGVRAAEEVMGDGVSFL